MAFDDELDEPAPKKSKLPLILTLVGCAGGALIVACIALVMSVGWWGMGLFTDQVITELNTIPVIEEHLGEVESISVNFTATGDEPGPNTYVFEVTGTKGSGLVTAECITISAEREEIRSGTLELENGEVYDLFP